MTSAPVTPSGAPPLRRRLVLAILIALALVVGACVASFQLGVRSAASLPTVDETSVDAYAAVESRVVADTVQVGCQVASRETRKISVPALPSGYRPLVTQMSARVGARIRSGDLVGTVAGVPVVLLRVHGVLYRDLRQGDAGSDAQAVNAELHALRLLPGTPSRQYTAASQKAVDALFTRAGLPPPRVGMPLDRVVQVPDGAGTVTQAAGVGADLSRPDATLATVTFGDLAATCRVPVDAAPAFAKGAVIRLHPVRNGTSGAPADGVVERVGPFTREPAAWARDSAGGGSAPGAELPGYDVGVGLRGEVPTWLASNVPAMASLSETSVAASTAVPAAAVRQRASGDYVVVRDGGSEREVTVTVARVADGWAAVSARGLRDGMQVKVSP